jgi:hypothetical protein
MDGVLPLFVVKGLFGRRLVSVPMRDRGGILAVNDDAMHRLVAAALKHVRDLDCAYLELKSLIGLPESISQAHDLVRTRAWITTRVDLSPGRDSLWKALDRNAVRWAINNALRNGVHIESAESAADVDLFARLFARTRKEMGIPVYPPAIFHAIRRHMFATGMANLFIAYKDTTPINALISLMWRDTFYPAYAAPQNAWRKSYPSETLLWHTMEWAIAHGFKHYDFGGDSPEQTGLLRFKKKWGGSPHVMVWDYHLAKRASPPSFDSSSQLSRVARRVWKVLPEVVERPLGAWVTRQLS